MGKRFGLYGVALALVFGCPQAQAIERVSPTPGDTANVRDMETIVVTGMQPGPGLWRARHANGHTLYILGTQSPLPAGMTWQADEVREVLSQAGAVLGPPGVQMGADIGFFGRLTLAPSAFRAMRNPDGATLDTLLPPDLYQRWATLKQRYMGRDRGIERKRPFIAVYQLYRAAIEKNGLTEGGIVGPVIQEALKARDMQVTPTVLSIRVDDPRGALRTFRQETLKPEDLACVRGTLDIIERDLPRVAARANAWAIGDLDALRAMDDAQAQVVTCLSAWTASETARELGLVDIQAKVGEAWTAAVDKAIADHETVFASVPIDALLKPDGHLQALRRRGYTVLAPDESERVDEDVTPTD
ncbi:MAG: TraB/GumN family protein [Luteimonas sp.]